MIMAEWIYDECYNVLFNYVKKNKIDKVIKVLQISNTWIFNDPVLFVVTKILVALEENQNVRNCAGKLLDSLNLHKKLSTCSIQSGVNKVLNDSGTKEEYPNLSNLVSDIVIYQSKH
ncbi:unnamed protein product [Macrosiphum euphorbiae]|uniref:Uncharacterized protein n=1 Tax=Macrosiphum euphorbiae TaxID=13131 RepID=A0AAV0W7Z1_9HEMI|nr:unnamed protein product [Macrosiphum euphorbiae]